MRDEELVRTFSTDNWWEKTELPREIAAAGTIPPQAIAPKSALQRTEPEPKARDEEQKENQRKEKPKDDEPGPKHGNEPSSRVALDRRSLGLDGFMSAISAAFDKTSYLAEELSDRIARSPEGFLICRNAVIGRTGFQKYKVSEITDPEGLLKGYRDDEEIDLWRDPSEVFSPATIASFEGKTFTVSHPDTLLHPDNDRYHNCGHVQNIRKGGEPLPSGEWPLLADIIVKDESAIRAIENGARELSCGYTYELARKGYRWEQRNLVGNHVALVSQGRAGSLAKIYDSAPDPAKKGKSLTENEEIEEMYRAHGRRQIEAIRNSVHIHRRAV